MPCRAWFTQAFEVLLEDLETGFAKFEEDLIDFTSSDSWVREQGKGKLLSPTQSFKLKNGIEFGVFCWRDVVVVRCGQAIGALRPRPSRVCGLFSKECGEIRSTSVRASPAGWQ